MRARPTRSSPSSWARRSSRAGTSSRPRRARCGTLTSSASAVAESGAGEALVGRTAKTGRLRDRDGAFEFEPHHCFACGELNEHGLHLQLHTGPEGSWTELRLAERFQGWEEVAHGGIVATLLDEVMAWSVIGRGTWGVTARLNLAFKRPIPIGRAIRAEGWVTNDRRRTVHTAGHILDASTSEVLATGEGVFVAAPPDQLEVLKARYR